MTLNEVMTQTADAIREKTGTTEKIAPVNFAEEIKSISAGGGESGGSNWKYLDVSKMPTGVKEMRVIKCLIGMFGKFRDNSGAVQISPLAGFLSEGKIENMDFIYAVAYDKKFIVVQEGMVLEYETYLEMVGFTQMFGELGITEITKEQFYDLNA